MSFNLTDRGFKMKKILTIVIVVLCVFSFSSCGLFDGIMSDLMTGANEALTLVDDFCCALADDDIESAKGFMHTDSTLSKSNLSAFISQIEQIHDIDFSDGIAFKYREVTRCTYYDSNYGGSVYEADYEIVVGGISVDFFFIVVKNDNGYGIYSFGAER